MTWVSHILVGAGTGKLLGFKYALTAFGSVLPDLIEYFIPAVKHRGISHSLTVWLILLVIGWLKGIREVKSLLFGCNGWSSADGYADCYRRAII